MPRYVSLAKPPRSWNDSENWYGEQAPTIQVLVDDEAPRPTGLLDARGVEIYELRDKPKVGF